MDIKDSFSSLAKNISNGATQVAKKSAELVEVSKNNMSIGSNENKIYELYAKIGEEVFKRYKENKDIPQGLKGICEDINRLEEDSEKLIGKINKIKKLKKCSNCGEDMKIQVTYCPKCGLKQTDNM